MNKRINVEEPQYQYQLSNVPAVTFMLSNLSETSLAVAIRTAN